MQHAFRVTIFEGLRQAFQGEFTGAVELGRQRKDESGPYSTQPIADGTRVVVAEITETSVSRQQVRVDIRQDGHFQVKNLGTSGPLQLKPARTLESGQTWVCVNVARIQLGNRLACIELVPVIAEELDDEESGVSSLAAATILPGAKFGFDSNVISSVKSGSFSEQVEPMIRSLQAAIDVFQSAMSTADFYRHAVQALVDLVGLDAGRVLLWQDQRWKLVSVASAEQHEERALSPASNLVLNKVQHQKRTFWQSGQSTDTSASLMRVQSVVASPILDAKGQLVGVLYGDRGFGGLSQERAISRLEAMLVELLACSVASGLMRMNQEQALQAQRLRFEQFQSRKLADQLESQPDLLTGRDVEVSVLFADIRRFSKVSEALGAATTFEWMNDVMSVLSDCVTETDGIIVDFVGDEVMAMWGAPEDQPDHAVRACQAALKMLDKVPEINARWESRLPIPFEIGVGVNTGTARAGNVGSHRKFKYGALGNTVNLASRIQGSTKYLRSPCIISEATRLRLPEGTAARKLCDIKVVNIMQPVAIYELSSGTSAGWSDLRTQYEAALEAFHQREFRKAARTLGDLLERFPDDGPSLVLMSRAVTALLEQSEQFDPVWSLSGK